MVQFNNRILFYIFMITFLIINTIYGESDDEDKQICLSQIHKLFNDLDTPLECLRYAVNSLTRPTNISNNPSGWTYFNVLTLHIVPGEIRDQERFCRELNNSDNSLDSENMGDWVIRRNRMITPYLEDCIAFIAYFGTSREDIVKNVFWRLPPDDSDMTNNARRIRRLYIEHISRDCQLDENVDVPTPEQFCSPDYGNE